MSTPPEPVAPRPLRSAPVAAVLLLIVAFGLVQLQQYNIASRFHQNSVHTAAINRTLLNRLCAYEEKDYLRRQFLDKTILAPVMPITATQQAKYGLTDREVYVLNASKRDRNRQLAAELAALLATLHPPPEC